jgi:hypothetical protein
MSGIECNQGKRLDRMEETINHVDNILRGNGKGGLRTTVEKLDQSVEFLTTQMKENSIINTTLTTAVNGLLLFQREIETERKLREEVRKRNDAKNDLREAEDHINERFKFNKKHLILTLVVSSAIGVRKDPNTPSTFSWRHTARGFIKLIIAMIIIPWGIIYFSDILPILLNFITTDALLPEGVELNAEVNGFSAFLIGFGVDYLVRRTMTAAKKLNEKRK